MNKVLPRNEYLKQLPRKSFSSTVILFNSKKEILIVKPSGYEKTGWLIPGGVVDKGESLINAVKREALEEIGINVKIKKPLVFEYYQFPDTDEVYDALQCVFLGETLSDEKIKNIKIDNDEIIDFKFVSFEEMLKLVTPYLRNRLKVIKNFDDFYYLEHGKEIFEK